MFKWEDWSRIHWSGWSADTVNSVLKKLVETHGKVLWKEIYDSFNQALFDIAEGESPFRNPLSCLVLYRNDNQKNVANEWGATAS